MIDRRNGIESFRVTHLIGDHEDERVMSTANDADGSDASEERRAGERIADALIGRLDGASSAVQIATELVRSWVVIEDALGPILGPRGVAALYKRSLQLCSTVHPWLAHLEQTVSAGIDLTALETAFIGQADPEGLAAARENLRALCGLMVSLVGMPLTERLLRPVLPESRPDINRETAR